MKYIIYIMQDFYMVCMKLGVSCQDDISSVGESTIRQGLEGLTAHDDGLAQGQGFEMTKVSRQVERQGVIPADPPFSGDGCNDVNHSATSIL